MWEWINNTWRGSSVIEFESAYGLGESVARLKAVTSRVAIFTSPVEGKL